MDPKLNFIIICDEAEFVGTKLNIHGVFDSIVSDDYPSTGSMSIIVHVDIESGDHFQKLVIYKESEPDKYILDTGHKNFTVKEGKERHQYIHHIKNLLLPASGRYIVEVFVNNEEEPIGSNYFVAKLK